MRKHDERAMIINLLVDELPSLRAKLGISQDELAKRIGVSRQTVSSIESKRREASWNLFLSMFIFFISNESTYSMLRLQKGFISSVYKYLSLESISAVNEKESGRKPL